MKETVPKCKWISWICISTLAFTTALTFQVERSRADLFGGDVAVLVQILAEAISQVEELQSIIGKSQETVSILEEMNQGVKEVLRLAETSHIKLPSRTYEMARNIDEATRVAEQTYGALPSTAPRFIRNDNQTGVEGLFLSEDAFDYSDFLDDRGREIKANAVVASQATATRLTAESIGVLLHAVSHTNRLEAKSLEITSTSKIREAAKEESRLDDFTQTQNTIERDMKSSQFAPLNSFNQSAGGGQ